LARTALSRRTLLQTTALAGAGWLTALADVLARQAETSRGAEPAQSLILLWLAGGPSQLETFDPQPGKKIGGPTRAIRTSQRGVQLAEGLEGLAERMRHVSLVRSLVSKESDHERGTMMVKTGYRPDPTAVYPSIGAVCCHELPTAGVEIPRHISILPNQWPGRGGFLGAHLDAFKVYDPAQKVPDVVAAVDEPRYRARLDDLKLLEAGFARGRQRQVAATQHGPTLDAARAMMTSRQLAAFDIQREPAAVRRAYGETPFGRGCLAARRLIEEGVRCVEVTLDGWDTHANNFELCSRNKAILDPALSALIDDLRARGLWQKTVILCGGEFGRTPNINPLTGRDHWPHGFSMLLGGGRIRGGHVLGATDPDGSKSVHDPRTIPDLHATVLAALGLDPAKENISPVGRPIKLADGRPMRELLG
jgi:hypothetical protein